MAHVMTSTGLACIGPAWLQTICSYTTCTTWAGRNTGDNLPPAHKNTTWKTLQTQFA